MKGSYNAVTQEASGEYGRSDYQESRKNTLMSGGMLIAVIAVVAVIAWLFWDRLNASIAGLPNPVKDAKSWIDDTTRYWSDGMTGLVNGAGSLVNAR